MKTDHKDYRGKQRSEFWTAEFDESQTVQSDADLADLNKIIARYKKTGIVAGLNEAQGQFLDVSQHQDFAEVMRTARAAEMEFMKLPSKVREEFGHDVANWLDAAFDRDKREALVDSGVIENTGLAPEEGAPTGAPLPAATPAEGPA